MVFWQAAALVAAIIATGLSAGLLAAFGYAVMPGLRRVDDRTFLSAMRQINVAIINLVFLTIFFGALVLTAVAAVLLLAGESWPALTWTLVGLALYLAALVITVARNVPLNNRLVAAGPPDEVPDPATVRRRFEAPWVRWNLIRALSASGALACLVIALYLAARP